MKRRITGFATDVYGDPFAWLSCGHRQHVRHEPPFNNRPWVTTAEGRRAVLGQELDCVRCDRFEIPEQCRLYRRTPEFVAETVPAGLLRDHTTAEGVWGRIRVTSGQLLYVVEGLADAFTLTPTVPGIVVPEQRHRVEPRGAVSFHVEFWRVPSGEAAVMGGEE